jgi:hypothetical protein
MEKESWKMELGELKKGTLSLDQPVISLQGAMDRCPGAATPHSKPVGYRHDKGVG